MAILHTAAPLKGRNVLVMLSSKSFCRNVSRFSKFKNCKQMQLESVFLGTCFFLTSKVSFFWNFFMTSTVRYFWNFFMTSTVSFFWNIFMTSTVSFFWNIFMTSYKNSFRSMSRLLTSHGIASYCIHNAGIL